MLQARLPGLIAAFRAGMDAIGLHWEPEVHTMTNKQVAHAFAHKKEGKGSNFHSTGTRLYSYRTCIAVWHGDTCFVSSNNMTSTTAKQLSYARSALSYQYFSTPVFQYGYDDNPTPSECIMGAVNDLAGELSTVLRKRVGIVSAIERCNARRTEIINVAARFGVTLPDMPEIDTSNLDTLRKAEAAADAERYNEWLTTGNGICPVSYRIRGADVMTVRGDTVITGQGAECPLSHAVHGIEFWRSRQWPYQRNGHVIHLGIFTLDSIDTDGTVHAGCHTFTRSEIERFCKQWEV